MWYYNGEEYNPESAPEDMAGFVYRITNSATGKMYIGKKTFWSKRRVKQKNKKLRKVVIKESDWRNYYGSNKLLAEEVKSHGKDKYKREILKMCSTKGECSYYEAKLQFDNNVLFDENYYNEWIMCRIHSKHIKDSLDEDCL